MTAGFQAFTDSGVLQIDGLTPNYQLVQSFTAVSQMTSVNTVYNDVGRQILWKLLGSVVYLYCRLASLRGFNRPWRWDLAVGCEGD